MRILQRNTDTHYRQHNLTSIIRYIIEYNVATSLAQKIFRAHWQFHFAFYLNTKLQVTIFIHQTKETKTYLKALRHIRKLAESDY